jgi:tetratricopeptide (TPR) repeat protein
VLCLVLSSILTSAQETVLYKDSKSDYEHLVKEFDQGYYGRCVRSAEKFLASYQDPSFNQLRLETELYQLKSKLRMDSPGAIEDVLAFAKRNQPGAIAQRAILLAGDDAYSKHQYDQAIDYLSSIDDRFLSGEEKSGLHFKLGYCLFVRKEFDQAAELFKASSEVRDKYFYPSNYYYGMTQYFKGNYSAAISSFERVAPSDFYKDYIPYYITQIHFNNKEYKDVIGYGNQSLASASVLNKTEIRQLIGQAYFETGDYANAIPHLQYVEEHSDKLRVDDFYQLGMAYYKTGKYKEAIPVLNDIRNEEGVKSQYANYYLGRCYLETGDKTSARNSLAKASKMQDDPVIMYEATYHYGRLSAEAGDDREAIRVLQTIPSDAASYNDAQTAMAGVLTNTSDYGLGISELEEMKSLSPTLKGAYQKVCLYRGEQLIQEEKPTEAAVLLDKSLKYPIDKSIEARAYFWKGESAHLSGQYQESIQWYNKYFAAAASATSLPSYQSLPLANYNQGYNYLRLNNYVDAQKLFDASVTGMRAMKSDAGQSSFIQLQIYPDAVLRAGDCNFKRGQYDVANQYYNEAISNKYPGSDYAEFQNAIIKGLQNKPSEKISLLEDLVRDIPKSVWADDALFQIGDTYQDQNKMDNAIQAYERLVKNYKQSTLLQPALLRLGLLSYNSGKFDPALTYYKSIFQYNPDPETSREAMSAIQEIYVNELDKPDAYFTFASTIPGYTITGTEKDSILYAAAENHYAQAEYDKAVESFQKYIAANPTGLYTLKAKYLRAESLTLLKRYDDAFTGYEEVIKAGQSSFLPAALYKAALIAYNQKQDMDKAFAYYTAYIPLASDEEQQYEAMLGALRSAYKLNKPEEVYAMSDKVINHPRATEDHKALAHYYMAKIAYDHNSYDKALLDFNAVIRVNSAELAAESRYYVASLYELQGEDELAAKLAEEAARANVGYPFWVAKSLLLLSDIQYKAGDLLNARAILEAIVENFKGDETIMKEANAKLEKVKAAEDNQSRIKPGSTDTLELQMNPHKG